MGRLIAFDVIFFLLPFGIYVGWLFATRGRINDAGDWPMKTIGWLAAGGAAVMIGAMLSFIHFTGAPPGSTYVPAQYIDGELIPGHFE
ncbi:MAG: hypothetical protein KDJ86_19540 [Bauldia sp.]|uniref:DUF6111 family protein n=1 Tax=Bauldia sp. TaxID=2575872 RepID=UPI001DA0ECA5|nr:DUF6111 family protein [Bauldia sp.]MCB1486850.1 hypothetical protein [Bauldia sp.]MCB1497987.1 hypothetical protein [Bauldia sp.]